MNRRLVPVVTVLLALGCIPETRRALRTQELVFAHYEATPVPGASRDSVRELVQALPAPTFLRCTSLATPCLVPPPDRADPAPDVCLLWGDTQTCHTVEERPDGALLRHVGSGGFSRNDEWLYRAVDPLFAQVLGAAEREADAQISQAEAQATGANSLWVVTRGVVNMPIFTVGLQVQGGYRRWLGPYVLVAVGGGYERTLFAQTGVQPAVDALLLTARFELSSYDPETQHRQLNLPTLSGYFGATGVIGLTPEASWAMRAFAGVSAIVPVSIELGFAVVDLPGAGPAPNFYVAAGLGL